MWWTYSQNFSSLARSIDNPKTAAPFIVYLLLNFPLLIFIFASEASCCLGLGGGCRRTTVADETVNHDLWPYMRNNGNGKFDTSAILGIQQCSFPPCGHCFMAYRVGFIQYFPPASRCGELCHCGELRSHWPLHSSYWPYYKRPMTGMTGSSWATVHSVRWWFLQLQDFETVWIREIWWKTNLPKYQT